MTQAMLQLPSRYAKSLGSSLGAAGESLSCFAHLCFLKPVAQAIIELPSKIFFNQLYCLPVHFLGKEYVMDKMTIALKYANALPLPVVKFGSHDNQDLAMSLSAEMMQLGFVPSQELFTTLRALSVVNLTNLHGTIIPILKKMKGAHVKHKPFYPNFPQQVMEMSHFELYMNAIMHYWTFGHWRPNYDELPREYHFEDVKFRILNIIDDDGFNKIFVRLLTANESLSETDKKVIKWFMDNMNYLPTTAIPFKENLCYVAGLLLERGKDIAGFVTTTTDVLRIATHLSGGDISLAENTKFKSFNRKTRRVLVQALEGVIREEDVVRHKNKWVRLFHSLHVGDFSGKVYKIAKMIRQNEKVPTFNSRVESLVSDTVKSGYATEVVELLQYRPGDFARRLGHLLRVTRAKMRLVKDFLAVADNIPTRVLLQLYGNTKTWWRDTEKRVVFPKGGTQKARIISGLPGIKTRAIERLQNGIKKLLVKRFSKLDKLGKVYVDSRLAGCPLPTQQRSASDGLFQAARGTRLPIGDKNTLRFFLYWVGQDIDLSATLHDENFRKIEHISYTHLKSEGYQACHSGDITRAPNGASEFIDITIDGALKRGARYVVMNVFVFRGPAFKDHKECFAGWMTRSKPQSNEIFEPKTAAYKVDLRADARNCIPVIFDLEERQAILVDLATKSRDIWEHGGRRYRVGNNLEANLATIEDTVEAMVSLDNKTTLQDLFEMHAESRGEIVENKEDADIIFAIDDGITPYDISVINSEYVTDVKD
jgi:hypothetical protein